MNVFACLVHESPECALDLVRNLRCLDPESEIVLFNGGPDAALLDHGLGLESYGVHLHPRSRRLLWGRLHDFALETMRFALDHLAFDTLTIVDSDQLATRMGYSQAIAEALRAGPRVGMLVNHPGRQVPGSRVGPAASAFRETELWRPFLQRFPNGMRSYVHWSFWPGTVFTRSAVRALTELVDTDRQLQDILARSKIWASEEVILPTLVALLGFEIARSPCSYDFVQYRARYTFQQLDDALSRPDVFWVHPIPRRYDNPLRARLRTRWRHYMTAHNEGPAMPAPSPPDRRLLLTRPIIERMKGIEGWLEEDEADLLIAAAANALSRLPGPQTVVEVGSYCGRSTVVLGSVIRAVSPDSRIHAIDPHDGVVGALDRGLRNTAPTFDRFTRNIAAAGLGELVAPVRKHSYEVMWDNPIAVLFIDGLHDYVNVARDFDHFASHVSCGGLVIFHDYADYYPGVRGFVDELLATGAFRRLACVRSLMVLEKLAELRSVRAAGGSAGVLVSCIMPTHDRRAFVPRAIQQFLSQRYLHRELIIVDDGRDVVADIVPPDPRIRYVRLERRLALGAKRNHACELARGAFIAHWDDDDWMADWRLSYQVQALLDNPAADVCGLGCIMFHDPLERRAFEYVNPPDVPKWVAGGTMCYRRACWQQHPFAEVDRGEDTRFVRALSPERILVLPDHRFYVATMHAGSTTTRSRRGPRWHPCSAEEIERVMGGGMPRLAVGAV